MEYCLRLKYEVDGRKVYLDYRHNVFSKNCVLTTHREISELFDTESEALERKEQLGSLGQLLKAERIN